MTKQDLQKVFDKERWLSREGVGLGAAGREVWKIKELSAHRQARDAMLSEGREHLLERLDVITKVVRVMAPVDRIKSPSRKADSYYLKHVVENILGEYVSNAELIAACIHLGFDYHPVDPDRADNPNVYFNMSARSLKALANWRKIAYEERAARRAADRTEQARLRTPNQSIEGENL
jgi:hypothetical protein